MNLLQMSLSAGLMAAAVLIIRAAALDRLPKTVFLILWSVVLVRLLVPVSVSSPFSVMNGIEAALNGMLNSAEFSDSTGGRETETDSSPGAADSTAGTITPAENADAFENSGFVKSFAGALLSSEVPIDETALETVGQEIETVRRGLLPELSAGGTGKLLIIWFFGALAVFIVFAAAHLKSYNALRFSIPVSGNEFIERWRSSHQLLRPLSVMKSEWLTTPVAAGILKPRIILPAFLDMTDEKLLNYILAHEYLHIRRFHVFWKLVLAAALCVHWFNPFVWVMFVLAGRDLELVCDEAVLRRFGTEARANYAYSLIGMAERRRRFSPLYSGFSKSAAEERIKAIMKYRKTSVVTIILSAVLVVGTSAAFASGSSAGASPEPASLEKLAENIAAEHWTSPLKIYGSGIIFNEDNENQPSNEIWVTNIGPDPVTHYKVASLAYGKDGNPVEISWEGEAVKSAYHVYSIDQRERAGAWREHEVQAVERNIEEIQKNIDALEEYGTEQELNEWRRYLAETLQQQEEIEAVTPEELGDPFMPGQKSILNFPLLDGWDKTAGTHTAEYVIAFVSEVTFADGSVWENPEYEGWLESYRDKKIPAHTLENFYSEDAGVPESFSVLRLGSFDLSEKDMSEININWNGGGYIAYIDTPFDLTDDEIYGMFFNGTWDKEKYPDGFQSHFVQEPVPPLSYGGIDGTHFGYTDDVYYFYITCFGDVKDITGRVSVENADGDTVDIWEAMAGYRVHRF